jgi:hypothetical protein
VKSRPGTFRNLAEDTGFRAVSSAYLCDWLEERSEVWLLVLAIVAGISAAFMFYEHALILGLLPAAWSFVAIGRWLDTRTSGERK